MLNQLKDVSKVLILVATILYFFGFITVSAYLARFGIISFDIINARFIIAGIFSFFCVSIALIASWQIYKAMPMNSFFTPKKWGKRSLTFLWVYSSLTLLSVAISTFINLGRYEEPLSLEKLRFTPFLNNYDFIGDVISNLKLGSLGYDFFLKETLYLFGYALIIISIIYLVAFFARLLPSEKVKENDSNKELGEKSEITEKEANLNLVIVIETFILCAYCALAIYSYYKVRINFFDFNSLSEHIPVSSHLVFAWLYGLIFLMYIFLNFSLSKDGFKIDKNLFTDIDAYELSLRQILIPVISATIIFGWAIFPRIPYTIGGGEPREINLKTKATILLKPEAKIYMLGESSQFIFLAIKNATSSIALEVNKNEIEYIETKRN